MAGLVLRGDRVVTPDGVAACDVAITDEKITAIGPAGSMAVPASARLIDLTGHIVMPGGIDPHVHCAWPMPSPERPW